MEKLFEQFIDFKSLSDSELSSTAWAEAVVREYDGLKEYWIDTLWHPIQRLRSLVGDNQRFELLFKVAKLILITPHCNAGIERVFCFVNKYKPAGSDRNRLDIEGLLSSILAVKIKRTEFQEKCYWFKPSERLLSTAIKEHILITSQKGNTNY